MSTQDVQMKDDESQSQSKPSFHSDSASTLQRKLQNLCLRFLPTSRVFVSSSVAYLILKFGAFPNTVDLKEAASFIEAASSTKEVRRISRAVRLTVALRRKLTAAVLSAFLDFALLPGSEAHQHLSAYLKVFE